MPQITKKSMYGLASVGFFVSLLISSWAFAGPKTQPDFLVQTDNAEATALLNAEITNSLTQSQRRSGDVRVDVVTETWLRVQGLPSDSRALQSPFIKFMQPNYKISLKGTWKIEDRLRIAAIKRFHRRNPSPLRMATDNPAIPDAPAQTQGTDPMVISQWGMLDIGADKIWPVNMGDPKMIVAVIDTGVDYTHEDLMPNLWRNPGEAGTDARGKSKATNGVDDDNNGFIDDVVGWDFVSNDNKPYDLSGNQLEIIQGANPGHGTHCAGNVAAAGLNSKGIAGVAPKVSIMSLRFITEKGQGTTADAIKAIRYAVDNGAKVLSNSWGSEGDDPSDEAGNKALKEAIQYSQDKGVLFIAAAGNGHQGVGYNNDTDAKPAVPASYSHENIISVAAIDAQNKLGGFSNWGKITVDLAAPGVKVFSTTVDSKYSDMVLDYFGFKASWDGTSMAAPHVAGAAALYWSAYPDKSWKEVKAAIMGSVTKVDDYENKLVSGGKLNITGLMK